MEYLRQKKKKIIKAAEDLQFCFVWIRTVDQSINRNLKKNPPPFALFYLRVVGMPVTKQQHKAREPWLRQSLMPWWARICSVPKGNPIFTDFSGPKKTEKNILYSLWTLQISHTSAWKPPPLGWVLLSLQVHCEFSLPILHTERPICKSKLFWQRVENSK